MEFPPNFFVQSPHNQARHSTCLFCLCVISRSDWRSSKQSRHPLSISQSPALASRVRDILPDFSNTEEWMPASVCSNCRRHMSSLDVATAKTRLASIDAQQLARDCDGRSCDLCKKVRRGTLPVDVKADRAKRARKRKEAEELKELPPPTRRRPIYVTRHIVPPPVQFDERDVISEYRRTPKLSGRGVATMAKVYAENHAEDIAAGRLEVVSPAKARRIVTDYNRIFSGDFESKDCPFTQQSDGGAVMCRDAKTLMLKLVWILCRKPGDVLIIRIYADSGKGSFKLLCSFVFNDDPLVNPEAPEGARALHAARKEGVQDTGVLRVWCIGLLEGAKEDHDSVRWLFDTHESLCQLPEAFPYAMISLPLDHKMQNFATGIKGGGCRFPEVHTHWSQWPQHSKPEEERTVQTVLDDYEAREAAANEGRDSDPKNFHSVVRKPIKLLQALRHQPMMLSLPVAQLHETLGEAASIHKFFCEINDRLARRWLRELKIRPSDRHGRTAFDGKYSRALFSARAIEVLRRLVADFPCRSKGISLWSQKNIEFLLKVQLFSGRQELLELLVAAVEAYGFVIEEAMSQRLGQHYRTACEAYERAWELFGDKYEEVLRGRFWRRTRRRCCPVYHRPRSF